MIALTRIPAALVAGALVFSLGAALALAGMPPREGATVVVVGTALLAAAAWALADLERFVLVGVLGATIFPLALAQPGGALVAAVDVLVVIALGAWLVRLSVGAAPAPWISANPMLVPVLLFAAVTGASLAWSVDLPATVKATVQIIEIVVVLPLLFASLPSSVGSIRRGLGVYVGLASVLALVAFAYWLPRAAAGDLTGQYLPGLHKNAIGSFVGVGLVLSYGLWLGARSRRERTVLGLASLIQFAGLAASVSRGAFAGALLGVVVVSMVLGRRRLLTLGLVVVAVAPLLALNAQVAEETTVTGQGYPTTLVREYSFDNAIDKIAERPLLGTGAGTYYDFISQLEIGLADPNNVFLLTWAELGVLGLAALGFLLYRFVGLFAAARRLTPSARVVAVAAGAGVLSLLVHFQVDSTWTRGTASLCFALIGLMLALLRLDPRGEGRARTAPARGSPSPGAGPRTDGRPAAPAALLPAHGGVALASPQLAHSSADQASGPTVLHVVSSAAFAGIERHVLGLARELRARGCVAALVCPPGATRLREEAAAAGIPVHPRAGARRHGWVATLARRLASDAPDVLHLHDGHAALAGTLLAPLGRPLVVRTQHFVRPASTTRSGWRHPASLLAHRALNRRLHGYIAVSGSVAEGARRRRETGRAAVGVIPPGIELPEDEAVARAQAARERLPAPVVAFVGRLEAEKRLDVLLRAMPDVLARVPSCRLVIAGAGGAGEELRVLAGRLGIGSAVTWTGEVAGAGAVLEGAHVFVNPSPAEGFGLATVEAMAYALPAVAIASGASGEIVENGETGLLVPGDDPAALGAAIAALAGDRPRAAAMGARARPGVVARYGAQRTAELTLAFYRELAQDPPA